MRPPLRPLAAACCLVAAPAAAQEPAAAQANNPLANTKALNFQNSYYGDLTGGDRDANTLNIRYAQPFAAFGGQWLMRATLPVNTVPKPGGGDRTGIGDFNIFAALLVDLGDPALSFGIGPLATLPTATDDLLGSEKWSLGFANVLFNASSPRVQWGYLLTWQASVAGDDARDDVNIGAFQPFGFLQLGQGWHLRSTATWTYDFNDGDYAVPLGLGAGKVIRTDFGTFNAFIEPQLALATAGPSQPEWSVFGGVNFQF